MITLSMQEWIIVRDNIIAKHGQSMGLVRDKMRRELGFWPMFAEPYYTRHAYIEDVHLDFFDGAAETMFRLQWL
jgi:hypothetical protein